MAYASSCLGDEWSLFNNVGGLGHVTSPLLSATYDARPQLQGANRTSFVANLPAKFGTTAIGAFRFGDDVYNEQKVSLGFGNRFGLASLGASINYIQYSAQGFGVKNVLTFNFGGIATLTKKIKVGAHIQNINQPIISETDDEHLPTLLTIGLAITPSENVILITELQKDLDQPLTYKTGVEYKPVKKFAARTGFMLHPNKLFMGVGFLTTRLLIDYAFEYAPAGIGYSHQASIGYKLKSK